MKGLKKTTYRDYSERMLKVLVFIQRHLDEDVLLEELAEVACFSPYHFHRIFRGMIGESVKGYVRRLRLERAAQRLKNSARSITDIAFEAGYEAHESFTRHSGTCSGSRRGHIAILIRRLKTQYVS
jgi:AraC family transcriptional regulator